MEMGEPRPLGEDRSRRAFAAAGVARSLEIERRMGTACPERSAMGARSPRARSAESPWA